MHKLTASQIYEQSCEPPKCCWLVLLVGNREVPRGDGDQQFDSHMQTRSFSDMQILARNL